MTDEVISPRRSEAIGPDGRIHWSDILQNVRPETGAEGRGLELKASHNSRSRD
jgi:hypothetical protein